MKRIQYKFSHSSTDVYLDASFAHLGKLVDKKNAVIITDEHIFKSHQPKFKGWNSIVLKPGEEYKVQATADAIVEQLLEMETDRSTTLVGVGGGVVTDITGYVASTYMRGIPFGFVPTSLLAMVDASIGGKNGIDVGVYKNMVGCISQPGFILYDVKMLDSLPLDECRNGFAEIIKHSCIKDAGMLGLLEKNDLEGFRRNYRMMAALVERNVKIKMKVVQSDEFENGERRLLNFGHTLGHALENQYELSHGQAVAIGMTYAAVLSSRLAGFRQADRVIQLIQQYGLPTYARFNLQKVFSVLKMDKKRERNEINFVLLEKIGKGTIRSIPLMVLKVEIHKLL